MFPRDIWQLPADQACVLLPARRFPVSFLQLSSGSKSASFSCLHRLLRSQNRHAYTPSHSARTKWEQRDAARNATRSSSTAMLNFLDTSLRGPANNRDVLRVFGAAVRASRLSEEEGNNGPELGRREPRVHVASANPILSRSPCGPVVARQPTTGTCRRGADPAYLPLTCGALDTGFLERFGVA